MSHIFKLAAINSVRLIRAASALEARSIAYRLWHIKSPAVVDLGQQCPDIGEAGYNRVVHGDADTALFIARRTTGKIADRAKLRGDTKPSQCTVTNAKRAALYAAYKARQQAQGEAH
jgi:hypothetical protein